MVGVDDAKVEAAERAMSKLVVPTEGSGHSFYAAPKKPSADDGRSLGTSGGSSPEAVN